MTFKISLSFFSVNYTMLLLLNQAGVNSLFVQMWLYSMEMTNFDNIHCDQK